MEKITKKKKAKKGLKKRIGLIAIGGLSLVLTICLSVGATLAWFAGSTWSSNQLYMGGPVYVEMAGRGAAGATKGNGEATANWVGGAGNLDIQAATARTTGTVKDANGAGTTIPKNILLPGQKFEIYSQARVFSTAYTSSVGTDSVTSGSSGANTTNTEKSGTAHITDKGRITSTTTSVLRARFSISVEFDPSVGFNNFTDTDYAANYPKQSGEYRGAAVGATDGEATVPGAEAKGLAWTAALGAEQLKNPKLGTGTGEGGNNLEVGKKEYKAGARRDAVPNANGAQSGETRIYTNSTTGDDLVLIKNGTLKSIYKWKFVSSSQYYEASEDATTASAKYMQMGAPFDGSDKSTNSQGYYGVWILKGTASDNGMTESDSFYKARCNAYIDSYVEEYISEYGNTETRTIADSISALENSLNQSFVQLVNDSSDAIIEGNTKGMTVDSANGKMTYVAGGEAVEASWLYIDPSIGNDTNTNELSTSTGGWWYLVECDNASVKEGANNVKTCVDSVTSTTAGTGENATTTWSGETNTPAANTTTPTFKRKDTGYSAKDEARLTAKLYEINPLIALTDEVKATNNGDVTKVVSYSFPFVNGSAALPGDALTNIFANAKITFQISFQALQAFFPFSTNIDKMDYTNPLLGTEKALNIKNAIPIFNEAFDYQEKSDVSSITGL